VNGQPTVKVEVSSDTISIGEVVEVTYTIANGEGKFNIPDMNELPVISGPNTSSSFIYQDGKMTSNQSYSFQLQPLEKGNLLIPKATYETKEQTISIQPVEIVVLQKKEKPATPKTITETSPAKSNREKRKF
jgi:hypothetical protein